MANNEGGKGETTLEQQGVNKMFAQDEEELEAVAIQLEQIGTGSDELVRKAPRVTIILHNTGDTDGDKSVFFAVNSVGYMIPREKKVSLPVPIVAAIQNSVETRYFREEDERGPFGPIKVREVARFPITIVS